MLNEQLHISDEELLQATDGELSGRRTAQVQAHLAACWNCRARMADIESAIAGFARAHRESEPRLPSADGPRAMLRAEMAELAHQTPTHNPPAHNSLHSWLRLQWINAARIAAVCGAVIAAGLVGGLFLLHPTPNGLNASSAPLQRGLLPERNLTPGATRNISIGEVCSAPHEDVVREVSGSKRKEVFDLYGIANARPDEYEIDYLIAPGLGGTEDLHNLWPQPSRTDGWNAFVKDDLEERLHQMVCSGNLDLSTAQRDIATDWIAAYKKYFHTDAPVSPRTRLGAAASLGSPRLSWKRNI